jgi:hypothetical protein
MSDHSIEHTLTFNTARRILKFVAPDFRALATRDLDRMASVLDLDRRTIEVPEGFAARAAGIVVFYAGLLRLRGDSRFYLVFPPYPGDLGWSTDDQDNVLMVSRQHAQADQLAYEWAMMQMESYFPKMDPEGLGTIVDHRMTEEQWIEYFSEAA